MCGIAGFLDLSRQVRGDACPEQSRRELEASAIRMADTIHHRGPDDSGVWVDAEAGIALGFRRLAIIDLSPTGHQPMHSADGRYIIVFNGEVYNFKALRQELDELGYTFRGSSDTEVMLAAISRWGVETAIQRFIGMFAFALWDRQERRLYLVRDRLGIKPLYYYLDESRLIFASEIKAILADSSVSRQINYQGVNNFFTYGHAVAPDTIYQGIKKLLPAHYLECGNGRVEIKEYWDVYLDETQRSQATGSLTEAEYADKVYELLRDSVRYQLVSDVPLGAFLSGGIDSSTIVGLMSTLTDQPVKTFSVGFETCGERGRSIGGAYNELDDARVMAEHFRTDHHELRVKSSELIDALQKLVYHYDEPFGDAACFPTYLVSGFARDYVKVALTGEGSDEIFGGYRRYLAERLSPLYQSLPLFLRQKVVARAVHSLPRFRRLKKAISAMSVPLPDVRYGSWLTVFDDAMKLELFSAQVQELTRRFDSFEVYRRYYNRNGSLDILGRLMYTDLKTWLPDTYLEKTDKASMAVGLEARVPFLDHRLVEFAAQVPSRYKINGWTTKYILKKAVRQLLPESVLRKRKHGFAVPTDPWFRGDLQDFVFEILMDERTRSRGYFNFDYIGRLYKLHHSGKEVYDGQLWLLLNFELWNRAFMD
jgi:asparagine synthase (glutamine-hydrolysing)